MAVSQVCWDRLASTLPVSGCQPESPMPTVDDAALVSELDAPHGDGEG